jgi:hypothetical protein
MIRRPAAGRPLPGATGERVDGATVELGVPPYFVVRSAECVDILDLGRMGDRRHSRILDGRARSSA